MLARASVLLHAALFANVGVVNDEVGRLIFFMLGARVVKISELVEGEFAVALGRSKQMSFIAAIRRQLGKLLHALVTGHSGIAIVQAASAGDLLNAGVEQSGPE